MIFPIIFFFNGWRLLLLIVPMWFREKVRSTQKIAIKVKKDNNYLINNFQMKTILINLDNENNTIMIIIANKNYYHFERLNLLNKN